MNKKVVEKIKENWMLIAPFIAIISAMLIGEFIRTLFAEEIQEFILINQEIISYYLENSSTVLSAIIYVAAPLAVFGSGLSLFRGKDVEERIIISQAKAVNKALDQPVTSTLFGIIIVIGVIKELFPRLKEPFFQYDTYLTERFQTLNELNETEKQFYDFLHPELKFHQFVKQLLKEGKIKIERDENHQLNASKL